MLSNEFSNYPLVMRLKPLTEFLSFNFQMLRNELYFNLFCRFLKQLWNNFHEVSSIYSFWQINYPNFLQLSKTFLEILQKFNDTEATNPKAEANDYLKMIEV